MGRTVGCFQPLEGCIVPSGAMKVKPQGGDIQVYSSSGSLTPVSEVHDVF